MNTKNLGQIAAIVFRATAPTNTKLIWYDTVNLVHKVYDGNSSTWVQMSTNTTTEFPFTFVAGDLVIIGLKSYSLTITHNLGSQLVDARVFDIDVKRVTLDYYQNTKTTETILYLTAAPKAGETWSGMIRK